MNTVVNVLRGAEEAHRLAAQLHGGVLMKQLRLMLMMALTASLFPNALFAQESADKASASTEEQRDELEELVEMSLEELLRFTVATISKINMSTLATLLSCLIQFIVGVRLLLLAKKTRAWPEFLIGLALFLVGTGKATDLCCQAVFGQITTFADMIVKLQFTISHLLFFLIWCVVFRQRVWWARVLSIAAGLVLAGGYGYQAVSGWQITSTAWATDFDQLRVYVASVGFAWGTIECFIYYARLRKQIRFGLVPASTAFRVLLWGCVMAANTLLLVAIYLSAGLDIIENSTLAVIWVSINLFSGIGWWLSFLTPKSILRMFDRLVSNEQEGEP
jgi:hypothetical protein